MSWGRAWGVIYAVSMRLSHWQWYTHGSVCAIVRMYNCINRHMVRFCGGKFGAVSVPTCHPWIICTGHRRYIVAVFAKSQTLTHGLYSWNCPSTFVCISIAMSIARIYHSVWCWPFIPYNTDLSDDLQLTAYRCLSRCSCSKYQSQWGAHHERFVSGWQWDTGLGSVFVCIEFFMKILRP